MNSLKPYCVLTLGDCECELSGQSRPRREFESVSSRVAAGPRGRVHRPLQPRSGPREACEHRAEHSESSQSTRGFLAKLDHESQTPARRMGPSPTQDEGNGKVRATRSLKSFSCHVAHKIKEQVVVSLCLNTHTRTHSLSHTHTFR